MRGWLSERGIGGAVETAFAGSGGGCVRRWRWLRLGGWRVCGDFVNGRVVGEGGEGFEVELEFGEQRFAEKGGEVGGG